MEVYLSVFGKIWKFRVPKSGKYGSLARVFFGNYGSLAIFAVK